MAMAENSMESHICVFCSQIFPSKTELQAHFRLHGNGEIDIKGRPTVIHRNTTEEQNAIKYTGGGGGLGNSDAGFDDTFAECDVCGEVFRTVSLAISHKFRKHPNSHLKHYCPHCGMMFPIKANRDKHLLIHAPSTPKQLYPCKTCGVIFYSLRAKKFHMDSAHKGAIRLVNPISTPAPSMKIVVNNAGEPHSVYYCHLCGCEYQVKYNLQKHLAASHSGGERNTLPQEVVKCNLCSALFYTKRAYEVHSHHHRDGDIFAKNEEMRQQVVQKIDQDFDQRRVPSQVERYLSTSATSINRSFSRKIRVKVTRLYTDHTHTHTRARALEGKGRKDLSTQLEVHRLDEGEEHHIETRITKKKEEDGEDESQDTHQDLRGRDTNREEGSEGRRCVGWSMDERTHKRRRMMDEEDEEDDSDMRMLGTVNPDSVLSTQLVEDVDGVVFFGAPEEEAKEEEQEQEQEEDENEGSVNKNEESGNEIDEDDEAQEREIDSDLGSENEGR